MYTQFRQTYLLSTCIASGDGSEQQVQAELKLFDKPDALSNMILVVEDTELHVHKEVCKEKAAIFKELYP